MLLFDDKQNIENLIEARTRPQFGSRTSFSTDADARVFADGNDYYKATDDLGAYGNFYNNFDINKFKNYINKRDKFLKRGTIGRLEYINRLGNDAYNDMMDYLEDTYGAANVKEHTVTDRNDNKIAVIDYKKPGTEFSFAKGEQFTNKEAVEATRHLESLNPDTKFLTSKEEIKAALKREGHDPNRVDEVNGAFVKGGKVILNLDNIGVDTPFHEVGHGYLKTLKAQHPDFYKKGAALAKNSKTYKELKGHPDYAGYPEDRFLEEVMAHDLGYKGAEIFSNKRDATRWDNFVKKAKEFVAGVLGMSPEAFEKMTYGEFIEGAAADIATSPDVLKLGRFEKAEQENAAVQTDAEVSEAIAQSQDSGWWKSPSKWVKAIVPPAADDYHGLVSKIKSIAQDKMQAVTDAYVAADHKYKEESTKIRDKVKGLTKALPFKLSGKFGTLGGISITNESAIQAIARGVDNLGNRITDKEKAALNKLAEDKGVQNYINTLKELGVIDPSRNIFNASQQYDVVNYIANDLYKNTFDNFNNKREEVFSKEALEKIGEEHGEKYRKALENSLSRMKSGKVGAMPQGTFAQKWHDFLQGSIGVTMFFNFRSAALQTLSTINYAMDSSNPLQTMANIANVDKKLFTELWNHPHLRERRARAGFDVNANEMLDSFAKGKISAFQKKLLNKGFAATSAVDSFAIALGGQAYIRTEMSNGKSKEQAIANWRELTEEAQQSARPDRVSQHQASSVSKFILAFANTPAQYFRLTQKAARSIKEGKDVKKNVAKLVYYAGVQNAIFTMAQSASMALLMGFSGDEQEDKKALDAYNSMSSSLLRGMGLIGAVIDTSKNVILQAVKEEGKVNPDHVNTALKALSISPPLNRKMQDLLKAGRSWKYDRDKTGIESPVVTTVARAGSFANLPTDWVVNKGAAAYELSQDNYEKWQSLLLLLGWSKFNFDEKDKKPFKSVKFGGKKFGGRKFKSKKF